MFWLNTQDCTAPKQDDETLIVVDCNDAVTEKKEREQESHTIKD